MKIFPFSKFFFLINLYFRISPRIFEKIRFGSDGLLRGPGETDSWKNLKLKISCQAPFNAINFFTQFMRVDWRRARGSPATTPTSTPCGPLPSGRPPPKPSTRQQERPSQYIQLFTDQTMDQITIKITYPKCRIYWRLIEFVDRRYRQSRWYFRPALWSIATLLPPSLCE
jgi:hypothetical protein